MLVVSGRSRGTLPSLLSAVRTLLVTVVRSFVTRVVIVGARVPRISCSATEIVAIRPIAVVAVAYQPDLLQSKFLSLLILASNKGVPESYLRNLLGGWPLLLVFLCARLLLLLL